MYGSVDGFPAEPHAGLPPNWTEHNDGQFATQDRDILEFEVQPDAVSSDVVEFRLEASDARMWRKILVMPDGEGHQSEIVIDPSQGVFAATGTLRSLQVRNNQQLELWKAKVLGVNTLVLTIGNLEPLVAGTRVVFRWMRD
jgi:hypothetical protein